MFVQFNLSYTFNSIFRHKMFIQFNNVNVFNLILLKQIKQYFIQKCIFNEIYPFNTTINYSI